MAILLTLFVIVGLPAGWFDDFWTEPFPFHVMVWGCILVATLAGVGVEVGFARYGLPDGGRRGAILRRIGATWGPATAVSAVLFVFLLTPLFDGINVVALVAGLVVVELAGVTMLAALIESRAADGTGNLRYAGRFVALNLASMIAGVAAGRLFLAIFYPGVG